MHQKYKKINPLKSLPFYSEEIKKSKKGLKKLVILNYYPNYHFLIKNLKNYLIKNYQKHYHFFQKNLKERKDPEN